MAWTATIQKFRNSNRFASTERPQFIVGMWPPALGIGDGGEMGATLSCGDLRANLHFTTFLILARWNFLILTIRNLYNCIATLCESARVGRLFFL